MKLVVYITWDRNTRKGRGHSARMRGTDAEIGLQIRTRTSTITSPILFEQAKLHNESGSLLVKSNRAQSSRVCRWLCQPLTGLTDLGSMMVCYKATRRTWPSKKAAGVPDDKEKTAQCRCRIQFHA